MLRNKQSSQPTEYPKPVGTGDDIRQSALEYHLLNFLDNFDVYLFIVDPGYRQRLNNLLELFTDEEFDEFERSHVNRFVMN
ncbi:MAG TPA: hypothetical protein HPQ04_05075 [Rhodospirillaceae bacterium]|nr:hypothetical protein [Rhodospirillaceae bacterium]